MDFLLVGSILSFQVFANSNLGAFADGANGDNFSDTVFNVSVLSPNECQLSSI